MFFYTIPTKSVLTEALLEYSRRHDLIYLNRKDSDLCNVPLEMLDADPVMKALKERFGVDPFLLKHPPYTFRHWHQDPSRSCALNMTLGEYHSHTLFTNSTTITAMCDVEELIYHPHEMSLLNVKKFHSVLNLESDRLIFTMSILGQTTIEEVVEFCNAEGF